MKSELLTDDELFVIIQYRTAKSAQYADVLVKVDKGMAVRVDVTTRTVIKDGLSKLKD